jgi:hypothetical protein
MGPAILPIIPVRPILPVRRRILPVDPLPVVRRSGVLRGTWLFDFDAGTETATQSAADVWWEQKTATERAMIPLNGATICGMGLVDYNAITYADLQRLPLAATPIPANAVGTNLLPTGSTFAVRTKRGSFLKVQVVNYDYNLQLQWEVVTRPINYLDVKVVLGSTPDWLVTRYVTECSYAAPSGPKICGQGEFGPDGGIMQGQVSDETGAFPPAISLTVLLDFVPDTGVTALTKNFSVPVTATGANFIFEPFQVIQRTDLFLDLQPAARTGDFCLVKWKHGTTDNRIAASGQKMMTTADLRQQQSVPTCEIVFVPDPVAPKDLSFTIEGQFQGQPLASFAKTVDLSDKAILIRAQKLSSGVRYQLLSE